MKIPQSKCLYASVLLQSSWRTAALLVFVSLLSVTISCSSDDNPAPIEEVMVKGMITSYTSSGGAMLDITKADMTKAGFTFGDVISVTIDNKEIVMPYYDGFYGRNGEYLCVAYSTSPTIRIAVCNGSLPEELLGLEGHAVIIRMTEKGGRLDVQEAMSAEYSCNREDFPNLSDEEYANARVVNAGNIANGILHRCSSPFYNFINRAYYVSTYLEDKQVQTLFNLANTVDTIQPSDMPSYSRMLWEEGRVIHCPLKVDPTADDFSNKLIEALKELPSYPAPYAVHCMEGKDRTGYVCALLEGLCGATYKEIVADYLITFYNYYQYTPDNNPQFCNTLVSLRLNPCLMHYADVDDESQLPDLDYAQAFSNYLLSHGMSQLQLDALVQALTTP